MSASFPRIHVLFREAAQADGYRDAANRILNAMGAFLKVDIDDMLDLANGRRPRDGRTILQCWDRGPDVQVVVSNLRECPAVEAADVEGE
jgi:hypothetical protein